MISRSLAGLIPSCLKATCAPAAIWSPNVANTSTFGFDWKKSSVTFCDVGWSYMPGGMSLNLTGPVFVRVELRDADVAEQLGRGLGARQLRDPVRARVVVEHCDVVLLRGGARRRTGERHPRGDDGGGTQQRRHVPEANLHTSSFPP